MILPTDARISSGIDPLDDRTGGLQAGGVYLVVGESGPAKMVTALQFLHAGLARGERGLLLTNAATDSILDVASAWGLPLTTAWETGHLQVLGFRDDFELRALRSIEPAEVLEELDALVDGEPSRVAVDPGSLFLTGGPRTILGSAFLSWARAQPATLLTTFSVGADSGILPHSAEWLINTTTGRLVLERRSGGLYQITQIAARPRAGERQEAVSIALEPGAGLVRPRSFPDQRAEDRSGGDPNRLLLLSLDRSHGSDMETWATHCFDADIVAEPLDAVTSLQEDRSYGCVLLHASRSCIREAVQTCRALRPLTRAAIVLAADDGIRSTDRIALLEAGADDCLSGGLDFRELGLRIRQCVATGARPSLLPKANGRPAQLGEPLLGGIVPQDRFAKEVERRGANPALAFFCVLDVRSLTLSGSDLEARVAALVRSEDGDLVSEGASGCLVLLQGVRESYAGTFIDRLRGRLDAAHPAGAEQGVSIEILSHPAESAAIGTLLGAAVGHPD